MRVINILKHGSETVLLGFNVFLIAIMSKNPEEFKPPQCQARDIFALLITINFIVITKSIVNLIIQKRNENENKFSSTG